MRLAGLHHITMITGDAQRTVGFYVDVLGLRLVKKTINFDDPYAYHLYFGDESGTPGSILTWFEYAGARRGGPGAGMIHTIQLGVPSEQALGFWETRLAERGFAAERGDGMLRFADREGLGLELVSVDGVDAPLRAWHPQVPEEFALVGLAGARAYAPYAAVEESVLTDVLAFTHLGGGEYRLEGKRRHFHWAYDPPAGDSVPGAGTVHHIAWATRDDQQRAWRSRIVEAGGIALGEPLAVDELGHAAGAARQSVRGLTIGASDRSSSGRSWACIFGTRSSSPRCSGSSSTAKPGKRVAISNRMPRGSRK